MALKQLQVNVAQELDDVLVLIVDVVKKLKDGKSPLEIGASELPNLAKAVAGLDQVPQEFKQDLGSCVAGAGVRMGELVDALLAPKAS